MIAWRSSCAFGWTQHDHAWSSSAVDVDGALRRSGAYASGSEMVRRAKSAACGTSGEGSSGEVELVLV